MRGLAGGRGPGEDTAKDDDVRRLLLLALGTTGALDLGEYANEGGSDDEYPVGRYHVAGLVTTGGVRLVWEFNILWGEMILLDGAITCLWQMVEARPCDVFVDKLAGEATITKISKQML